MPKLVLADVDGTIIQHGEGLASQRVAEVVTRMHDEGSALVPVTSRTAKLMGPLAVQMGLQHLGVLDGGGTLFDFRQQLRDPKLSRWLDPNTTGQVISSIADYCDEVYYAEDSLIYSPGAQIDGSSPSVFAVYPNESSTPIADALLAITGISAHTNRYDDTATHSCVQIVAQGVGKRSGVELLLNDSRYSVFAPEDIVAIGDGAPDRDLLLAVPEGARRIAVGDNPMLLEVANADVPPASQDGFAVAMERYVLN